jgi:uncharacterized OB-fold protein
MCESSFDADLPEEIDLDEAPGTIQDIIEGNFFAVTCPSCGTVLKPELSVRLYSKKRNMDLKVIPEIERLSLYLGKKSVEAREVLVGYAELYERAKVLADGLDPEAVEILKYFLSLKADEKAPEGAEIRVAYAGLDEGGRLLFHVQGIKEGEVAVLPMARASYDKIVADKAKTMKEEPFNLIFKGPYRSLRALEAEGEE